MTPDDRRERDSMRLIACLTLGCCGGIAIVVVVLAHHILNGPCK